MILNAYHCQNKVLCTLFLTLYPSQIVVYIGLLLRNVLDLKGSTFHHCDCSLFPNQFALRKWYQGESTDCTW